MENFECLVSEYSPTMVSITSPMTLESILVDLTKFAKKGYYYEPFTIVNEYAWRNVKATKLDKNGLTNYPEPTVWYQERMSDNMVHVTTFSLEDAMISFAKLLMSGYEYVAHSASIGVGFSTFDMTLPSSLEDRISVADADMVKAIAEEHNIKIDYRKGLKVQRAALIKALADVEDKGNNDE